MSRYDDIIDLSRPVSEKHPPMKRSDRAAQFAPFAALTGHGDAIRETARLVDEEIVLSEEEYRELDRTFQELLQKKNPRVSVTYFIYDQFKHGGKYEKITFTIRKIDLTERKIYTTDRKIYDLDRIIDVHEVQEDENV